MGVGEAVGEGEAVGVEDLGSGLCCWMVASSVLVTAHSLLSLGCEYCFLYNTYVRTFISTYVHSHKYVCIYVCT